MKYNGVETSQGPEMEPSHLASVIVVVSLEGCLGRQPGSTTIISD